MGKIFIDLQETIKCPKENIGANWFYVPPFAIYKYPRGKLKRSQFIGDWEMETKSSLIYKYNGFHSPRIYCVSFSNGGYTLKQSWAIMGKLSYLGFMNL